MKVTFKEKPEEPKFTRFDQLPIGSTIRYKNEIYIKVQNLLENDSIVVNSINILTGAAGFFRNNDQVYYSSGNIYQLVKCELIVEK